MSGETVFSKAADVIRERGHHKGWYEAASGAVCVHGATHAALGNPAPYCQEDCPAEAIYAWLAREHHVDGVFGIGFWNDAPERTVEDVLMVLKELHVEAGGS